MTHIIRYLLIIWILYFFTGCSSVYNISFDEIPEHINDKDVVVRYSNKAFILPSEITAAGSVNPENSKNIFCSSWKINETGLIMVYLSKTSSQVNEVRTDTIEVTKNQITGITASYNELKTDTYMAIMVAVVAFGAVILLGITTVPNLL
jgi:hypothetical protein